MATSVRAIPTVPVNDRDHVQGPADAPVTLVKYGDFECSYCAAAHVIVKKVQEIMADQGVKSLESRAWSSTADPRVSTPD